MILTVYFQFHAINGGFAQCPRFYIAIRGSFSKIT